VEYWLGPARLRGLIPPVQLKPIAWTLHQDVTIYLPLSTNVERRIKRLHGDKGDFAFQRKPYNSPVSFADNSFQDSIQAAGWKASNSTVQAADHTTTHLNDIVRQLPATGIMPAYYRTKSLQTACPCLVYEPLAVPASTLKAVKSKRLRLKKKKQRRAEGPLQHPGFRASQ
jgi:O-methyltransferase involved in polyketide biosynthesis